MFKKVGFTGTRFGMSTNQKEQMVDFLRHYGFISEFHHGKCVGADEQAHEMAWDALISVEKIIIHPPIDEKHISRACRMTDFDVTELKPREYLERNRDIVDATDMLVACPRSYHEEQRSGTWYTIRYAHTQGKPVILFL